jgi:hypothetical protein
VEVVLVGEVQVVADRAVVGSVFHPKLLIYFSVANDILIADIDMNNLI